MSADTDFSSLMRRSVTDILGPVQHLPPEHRLERVMPKERHPIAEFFTKKGRENAIGCSYAPANMSRYHSYADESSPTMNYRPSSKFRYGYLPKDWPAPLAYRDAYGAGLSYQYSPLGYMLYHDRSRAIALVMDDDNTYSSETAERELAKIESIALHALLIGSPRAGRYMLEVGRARDTWIKNNRNIPIQNMLGGDTSQSAIWLHTYQFARLWADPSGDEVATMILGKSSQDCSDTERVTFATIARHADDFQERWMRGEWWSGSSGVQSTLKILLGGK